MRDTPLWTWHVIAGLLILVLGGLHMAIMHYTGVLSVDGPNPAGANPLDWENVVHRAKQVGFMVSYIVLVAAGLFHGLYGFRNIVFELNPSKGVRNAVTAVLLVIGIGLFVLGTWAAIAARGVAMAAG